MPVEATLSQHGSDHEQRCVEDRQNNRIFNDQRLNGIGDHIEEVVGIECQIREKLHITRNAHLMCAFFCDVIFCAPFWSGQDRPLMMDIDPWRSWSCLLGVLWAVKTAHYSGRDAIPCKGVDLDRPQHRAYESTRMWSVSFDSNIVLTDLLA